MHEGALLHKDTFAGFKHFRLLVLLYFFNICFIFTLTFNPYPRSVNFYRYIQNFFISFFFDIFFITFTPSPRPITVFFLFLYQFVFMFFFFEFYIYIYLFFLYISCFYYHWSLNSSPRSVTFFNICFSYLIFTLVKKRPFVQKCLHLKLSLCKMSLCAYSNLCTKVSLRAYLTRSHN